MSTWRPRKCKRCGVDRDDDTPISKKGYCLPCAIARSQEAVTSMCEQDGDDYQRWRARQIYDEMKLSTPGVGGSES